MTTKSIQELLNLLNPPPSSSAVKPDIPATTARPPPPPPTTSDADADTIFIPSYSSWFSFDRVYQTERRSLPEFFNSRSPAKNPNLYKYYRNHIIKHYRSNPGRRLTFTDVRKTLVGDVGSIHRVFNFLEAWGLINYAPSIKSLKWEEKDAKSAAAHGGGAQSPKPGPKDASAPNKDKKRTCNGCKSLCSIACFVSEKYDMTLCARCYVRGNYQIGVNSSDFRRVEINEETGDGWADRDTLHLLEALMHYGDDWGKVAQHVGRSEKECVAHFLKLPFADKPIDDLDSEKLDGSGVSPLKEGNGDDEVGWESKRMRLTPLADASNPIMAQTAFLSALAGVKAAEAAARAAVTTLCEADYETSRMSVGPRGVSGGDAVSNGDTEARLNAMGGAFVDANSELEKEGLGVERAIAGITEVQMKEIQDRIVRFEELDLQLEKEKQQLEQMKSMLFVDQLTLLSHKRSAPKTKS
ncbi:SWI/SNF complex subunit SWI3B [Rosa rugosa]|uniref:SWI/SNF complex subunit SWI3B n=1 Tax=Rosa rugosa TaxID=74645 RepID=UPI002B4109CE|nr:SWI/SNF complex subunit SWI3B [Rosa rugosa]